MALLRSEGIVLKTHALGDTSRIVVAYTHDLGMLRFVAKGARKTPGRFGFALEPLSRSRFVFYHKADRDLQLLSQADTLDPTGSRLTELSRLAHPVERAEELLDLPRAGEIQRVVEAFLMQHFQRFRGLRSLELLRALPGGEPAEEPPASR